MHALYTLYYYNQPYLLEFSWLLNEDSLYCNFGIANNITVPLASEIENISMVDLFIQAGWLFQMLCMIDHFKN